MALEPPLLGSGLIACDLQRSVNILSLQLDAAADDANDAHAHAMDAVHIHICVNGVFTAMEISKLLIQGVKISSQFDFLGIS